jgi:hypothetical protein
MFRDRAVPFWLLLTTIQASYNFKFATANLNATFVAHVNARGNKRKDAEIKNSTKNLHSMKKIQNKLLLPLCPFSVLFKCSRYIKKMEVKNTHSSWAIYTK